MKSLHFLSLFCSGSRNVCMLVVSTWASNVCCYNEPRKPSTLLLLVCQRLHLRQTYSPRCHVFALKLPLQIWITPPDNHRARICMHSETTIQPFLQGPVEKKNRTLAQARRQLCLGHIMPPLCHELLISGIIFVNSDFQRVFFISLSSKKFMHRKSGPDSGFSQ